MNKDISDRAASAGFLSQKDILRIIVIAAAYFLAHQIAFFFPDSAKILMAVWPAGGIGLAALLMSPRRLWPAIIFVLFAVGNTANVLAGRPFINSIGFMTANILESYLCAAFMILWCGEQIKFVRIKEIVALICASTVINGSTACIAAGTSALRHLAPFWSFWETWWVADGLGILLVTPLIVSWHGNFREVARKLRWTRVVEATLFLALWCLTAWLSFLTPHIRHFFAPQPYMLFALLAWAALRFGMRGITLAFVIIAGFMLTSNAVNIGPLLWGGESHHVRMLMVQMFLGVAAVTGFLLAASSAETTSSEKSLRASENNYRTLVEQASDAIFIADEKGNYIDANQRACDMVGYSLQEILTLNMKDLLIPEEIATTPIRFPELIEGKVILSERRMRRKDGSILYSEINGKKLSDGRYLGMVRDIGGRKRQEEERLNLELKLQQAQKLEAIGVLAGGIAHDFNNLLTGIFGYIDLAGSETKDKKASTYLSKALATIDRARALTLQLLTFAKGGAPIRKVDRLIPYIQETAQFALSGSNVSCRFAIPPMLWLCEFDKNQIGQVIDNIVINAQQAMPAGGVIEISLANISLAEKEHAILPEGDYVRISVKDSGIGIPKEILPRIFDPFFTTKTKGHGLGLATSYSIVNRHGGRIEVESQEGKGSVFHIYLPACTEAAIKIPESRVAQHKGSGQILIMDDEEIIRDTIADMLQGFGYTVLTAKNGKETLDIVRQEKSAKGSLVAIILDLTIAGGMGGKATAVEIRKIDPAIPLFVASGYGKDPVMASPTEHGFVASIPKPFTYWELSEIMEKHLGKAKDAKG
jgi:PAS domain S-box-containing protein